MHDEIVMLPPYVAPEHRELIEQVEKGLQGYSESLIARLKQDNKYRLTMHTTPAEIRKVEIKFHEDPMRQQWLKLLGNVKALCERPRIMVKKIF